MVEMGGREGGVHCYDAEDAVGVAEFDAWCHLVVVVVLLIARS